VRDLNRCVGDRAAQKIELGEGRSDGRVHLQGQDPPEDPSQESWMRLDEELEPTAGPTGKVSTSDLPFEPTLFLYDNFPGGVGFSPQIFDRFPELLQHARRLLTECECEAGCPSCVGPPNEVGDKAKVIALELIGPFGESTS
ncbi:MAG: DUF1998 domain-containing protein, partial [Candidatus Eremiobacteraeota bacterium]|nr:DUF1998 domain-containing protein [Candidatus Eremiobacteraeota bacterium]